MAEMVIFKASAMNKIKIYPLISRLILLFSVAALLSCEKEPGFGGLAEIVGKVYVFDYNPEGVLVSEGYTGDIEVFLSVDGQPGVLERARTDFDGSYRFRELRKGTYNIWVFSDCDKCTDNKEPIIQKVIVSSNRQDISLEDFRIRL
jgi:hypothetical protein